MRGVEHGSAAARLVEAAEELGAARSRDTVLERVVQLSTRVIPAAQHASLTLAGTAGLHTAASTGELPSRIDAVQYTFGEGPCVTATREQEVVLVPDVAAEVRWPRFVSRIARKDGVGSLVALPLHAGNDTPGSLNLSAGAPSAFPDDTVASALVFASVATLALDAATERERRAKADARARELEDFTTALSHDLRSGLTGALAAAGVLARRRRHLDPGGQQALGLLTEELGSQMRVLVDLLDLARVHSRGVPAQPVALLPVVDEALRRHALPVDLRVQPSAGEAFVTVHPVRVRRILANLLDNADRHAGGATAVEVGLDAGQVWIAVDDAGPGVPPEQREAVFTRFRTTSTASPEAGASLGLALSREHARLAGGDLVLEDRGEGGSRFRLLLPRADPPAGRGGLPAPPGRAARSSKDGGLRAPAE
jgi:signal transduction histidine kinase